MAAALPFIAVAMTAASTVMSANAQNQQAAAIQQQANRRQTEANFEADQLDVDAGQALAVSHRQAEDEGLKARLLNSTVLARAAASGAGASDPTVLNIMARTSATGAYRQGVALYEGEEQARTNRLRAAGLRYSGDIGIADALTASRAANAGATATLLTGGAKTASLYSKYWAGPSTTAPSNPGTLDAGSQPLEEVG